jgi:sec-independent protein translocase protein TatB
MFGIGPTELIVILVIALLVLGPKRLPELAAGLGKGLAEFRKATADINAELHEARRAVEEPAKEATRATTSPAQPEKRVSRTRRAERPVRFGPDDPAQDEGAEAEDSPDPLEPQPADPVPAEPATAASSETTPKAPA